MKTASPTNCWLLPHLQHQVPAVGGSAPATTKMLMENIVFVGKTM